MTTELLSEAAVDRHIERVIQYHGNSDTLLKYACIAVSGVVGAYDGGTQQISKRTNRHVSTIEGWAHAHWMYLVARRNGHRAIARQLWRVLPVSHWSAAWDIQTAGYEGIYYLERAREYHYSSRDMTAEWKADRDAGHAPLILHRAKIALRGLAQDLLNKNVRQLTKDQCAALGYVIEAFEDEE